MMFKSIGYTAVLGCLFFCQAASAEVFVYPAKGQSAEQTDKDKYECYQWAKNNTGVDPMQAAPPAQTDTSGDVAKGVVGGAVSGLVIGNIAGGSGSKGAAAGALFGGIGSAARSSRRQSSQQVSAESQASYDRAFAACLEGRGYTVK